MSDENREWWDARHAIAAAPVPGPPGAVLGTPGLVDEIPTAGRALDVACGRGGVAVWLARRGLTVDAVDLSPVGLAAGAELAAAGGVASRFTCGSPPCSAAHSTCESPPCFAAALIRRTCVGALIDRTRVGRIRWILHDLDGGLPERCAGPYDVVICQRFRNPDRYGALAAALAPGGLLAVTVLSQVDAGPGRFRAAPGELRAAFPGPDVLLHRELDGEVVLLARAPGRRPVDLPRAPRGSRPAPRPPS